MNAGIKLRPIIHRWTRTLLFAGLGISAAVGYGYDSPTFDSKVFSADGIFLSASEKQSLLEALTALAVNFPSSQQVDSDLREKAIGIALQVDPLHYSSRMAHESLLSGKVPEKTGYFDSTSAVSEALWRTASTLLTPPAEPEEIRLAPFLMELSLLIHPEPPADRMESFALRTGGRSPAWKRFLDLDPDQNPSTRRSQMLLQEANDLLRDSLRESSLTEDQSPPPPPSMTENGNIFTGIPPTMPPRPPRPGSDPSDPDRPPAPFGPIQISLPTIRTVKSTSTAPLFGTLELLLRPPASEIEKSLFPYLDRVDPSEYQQLPLLGALRGIPVENLQVPAPEAARRGLTWPAPVIGLVSFESDSVLPGPRRLCKTGVLLPTLAALRIALGDGELNPDFLLAGTMTETGAVPVLEGELKDFVSAIPDEAPRYLLVPESSLEELVTYLQISQNLSALFAAEWISYDSADSAISILTSETDPALAQASQSFDEIEAVSERMSLVELARNAKVQERLQGILETYPRHLSARAMLEFGTRPVPETIRIEATATQITEIVSPFLQLQDDPDDLNVLRGIVEDAKTSLFRMKTGLPPELVDFHDTSVEVIDEASAFLSLTNTTTSLATQKLRELRGLLETWESSREELFDSF